MKTITTAEMKQMNRGRVFSLIYKNGEISKHEITRRLELSLPTVTSYLAEMQEEGMIICGGLGESTGGRRAAVYQCKPTVRVALGVEILIDAVTIIAMDIFGEVLLEKTLKLPFSHSDGYYRQVGDAVNSSLPKLPCPADAVAEATIAVQGLISPDGERVTFSEILGAKGITRMDFARYISVPCTIVHDTSVAAFAELWHQKNIDNALYISLNRHMGSALIIGGKVYKGYDLCGSTIEHMLLHQGGEQCYCKRHGCAQCYCSAEALFVRTGTTPDLFFDGLRSGRDDNRTLWMAYLDDLATVINNARMVFDGDIILGGELAAYFTDEDMNTLMEFIHSRSAFHFSSFNLIKAHYGKKAAVMGCALQGIDKYLQQFVF